MGLILAIHPKSLLIHSPSEVIVQQEQRKIEVC